MNEIKNEDKSQKDMKFQVKMLKFKDKFNPQEKPENIKTKKKESHSKRNLRKIFQNIKDKAEVN